MFQKRQVSLVYSLKKSTIITRVYTDRPTRDRGVKCEMRFTALANIHKSDATVIIKI